jgi:SpoVK/Ycf46/Vps4 family AAA+-type ATPase
MPDLWERKRQQIEQTPGLSVWRGGETFDDIAGVENIKSFVTRLAGGPQAPRVCVFLDEIEKAMGNAGGDTSGVKADQLGALLTWMQDRKALGIIAIGAGGGGKSMVAKATGNALGGLTISMDLGGMKGSLVGESEQKLRTGLKVIDATSQGSVLVFATCNRIAVLPPELRRRFTMGTFFFDLPTYEERLAIWKLYLKKYGMNDVSPAAASTGTNDHDWTGAEILQCCDIAHRLNCCLADAAAYVVPIAKSAADQLDDLRTQASGRFISASYPGIYRYDKRSTVEAPTTQTRTFDLGD